jgi:hypothetical protein
LFLEAGPVGAVTDEHDGDVISLHAQKARRFQKHGQTLLHDEPPYVSKTFSVERLSGLERVSPAERVFDAVKDYGRSWESLARGDVTTRRDVCRGTVRCSITEKRRKQKP